MKSNTNTKFRWFIRILIILFLTIILVISCDNTRDSEQETMVVTDFKSFYTAASASNQAKSATAVSTLERRNPDALRMIAYIWNDAALKQCAVEASYNENEIPLSDFDTFVQKEKHNFHLPKIDEEIKPCVTDFYAHHWGEITEMIRFNTEPAR